MPHNFLNDVTYEPRHWSFVFWNNSKQNVDLLLHELALLVHNIIWEQSEVQTTQSWHRNVEIFERLKYGFLGPLHTSNLRENVPLRLEAFRSVPGALYPISVTRLGDFLDFGQPFKAGCNNYFTQIVHIV